MDEYLATNRRHWDELVDLNARSSFYDLDGFKRGASSLTAIGASSLTTIEIGELGEVTGRTLLHLQCHFGMGTLSWARLGAKVTGVDFSEPAIALARSLSRELSIPAAFICADVYDLPRALNRTFDIVFTSYGVLCWLPNLARWGSLIAHFLSPGGTFYIVEDHPFAGIFAYGRDAKGLQVESPYFGDRRPLKVDLDGYYADRDAKLANRVTYEWQHSLSDIVNALIHAGLRIEFLHEHAVGVWQRFPFMERGEDGLWRLPLELRDKVPLTFSLRATKPPRVGSTD
jgi:SAM-dependent methyltransferase